jgi:flagellar biogenesis protein FliO
MLTEDWSRDPGGRRRLTASLAVALALGLTAESRADHPAPTAALSGPERRQFSPRDASHPASGRAPSAHEGSSGWWIGTAGVALALALCGWVSFASRRYLPAAGGGGVSLRVVGRTSLSPKQSVYLLQVGDRVLIVGAGGQGAPSLLGELNDTEALARLAPHQPVSPAIRLSLRPGHQGDDT